MAKPTAQQPSPVQRLSRQLAQAGLAVVLAAFVAGLAVSATGTISTSVPLLTLGFAVLAVMPVVAVLLVLVEEVQRRDWSFAVAALVVIALIGYTMFDKLR